MRMKRGIVMITLTITRLMITTQDDEYRINVAQLVLLILSKVSPISSVLSAIPMPLGTS